MTPHVHHVQIYYEDTDFSGVVYHANYLKFFERAREHMLGVDALVKLWSDEGVGFAVYRCNLQFKEGARYGDLLEIRSTAKLESEYRAVFSQSVWRPGARAAMVEGTVEMVAVNRSNQLVKIPRYVVDSTRGWP